MKLDIYLKSALVIVGLLAAPHAFSQDDNPIQVSPEKTAAAAAQAQQTPSLPQKVYLELEQADLNALSVALNELPKRVADPLIMKLNEQLKAQATIKEAAEKAKK